MSEKDLNELEAKLAQDAMPSLDSWRLGRPRQLAPSDFLRLLAEVRRLRRTKLQATARPWASIGPMV